MKEGQYHIPKLTGKVEINLKKKTVYTLSCPKCDSDMDVTSVSPNTYIECQECKNVTWRPDYDPPWWAKTRNFTLSLIGVLIIGIVTGFISNIIYDNFKGYRSLAKQKAIISNDSLNIKK